VIFPKPAKPNTEHPTSTAEKINEAAIMRDDDGAYLYEDDVTATKKTINTRSGEDARARIAAQTGYVDSEPTYPSTSRAQISHSWHTTDARRRIASIKRGGKARSASPFTGPSTTFNPPNTFTTTPSSFSFGAQQPQQQQQPNQAFGGNGSFTFGQQPSEGNGMDRIESTSSPAPAAAFTFGQSQPQQQPSSNGFGQQSSNPFGGFGQQNAAPNGGAQSTPSFGFGQQNQNGDTGSAPSNPFGGFGQQTQTNKPTTTAFGGFGAQSQSSSPAPTNPFTSFNAQPQQNGTPAPSNSFTFGAQPSNNQPTTNGSTTGTFGFGASQPAQQPVQTSSLFAPQPSTEQKSPSPFQGGSPLFSKPTEAPKADGWSSFKSASPAAATNGDAPGTSVLSGWQKEQTSKPAFSFSASQMTTDDGDDDAMLSPEKPTHAPQAPTFSSTSNIFGASQPAASAGSDLFSRTSKPTETPSSNTEQPTDNSATPKASGGDLFSRMTFPNKAVDQAVSATPAPKASNPFAGFTVAPPATAPAKNLFTGASSASAVPATPTPAADKAPESAKPAPAFSTSSLFSASTSNMPATSSLFTPKPAARGEPEAPATAKPTSSFSMFGSSTPKPAAQTEPETPATVKPPPSFSMFGSSTPKPAAETEPEAPATIKAAPSFTNSVFSSNTPKPSAMSLFAPVAPQQTTSTTTKPPQASAPWQAAPTVTAASAFDPASASPLRQLNEGLQQRLAKADPSSDFTQILKFYIKKADAIRRKNSKDDSEPEPPVSQTPKAAPPANVFERRSGETNGVDLTKSLFAPRPSDAQTPKPTSTNGLFGRAPATEPKRSAMQQQMDRSVKRSIEDHEDTVPHTDKRRKSKETVNYPKLPANASNTAKLFEAALDKPAESGAAAKSLFAPKPAAEATPTSTFGEFKPSTSSLFTPAKAAPVANGSTASNSLFAPKPAADAEKEKPKAAGGFMPTFAAPPAGGSSFLSSFGANASKEQDQALKKAMDEDFDSEDDDPVEWKKQYEAKQAAKRKAIEEAAKSGGGFSMKGFAPSSTSSEQKKPETAATEAPKDDNTWKQGTPIKFGANASTPVAPKTAPPKPSGMFGSNAGGSSLFANTVSQTPQPSSGSSLFSQAKPIQSNGSNLFSFGKTAESSTSGSTPKPAEPTQPTASENNNGDAAEGDEEAANEPQVEDAAALQPAEKEESDVLYHIEKAKSYKFETKPNADKAEWTYKALGPVWLLRNKSTGKTRLLQKVAPLGKAAINFNLLKSATMYSQQTKKVTASFVDHINEKEPKKPSQWFVQCGKEEDAKELSRLMKEEAAKQ
jgi:hypothetical protein